MQSTQSQYQSYPQSSSTSSSSSSVPPSFSSAPPLPSYSQPYQPLTPSSSSSSSSFPAFSSSPSSSPATTPTQQPVLPPATKPFVNIFMFDTIMKNSSYISPAARDNYFSGLRKYEAISLAYIIGFNAYVGYNILFRRARWYRLTTNWRIVMRKALLMLLIGQWNSLSSTMHSMRHYAINKEII